MWIPCFKKHAQPLIKVNSFPLDARACEAFNTLKQLLMDATLHGTDSSKPYVIECDASDVALSALLNQS